MADLPMEFHSRAGSKLKVCPPILMPNLGHDRLYFRRIARMR